MENQRLQKKDSEDENVLKDPSSSGWIREDMDEVRERLRTWWHGGDIGRPAMIISSAPIFSTTCPTANQVWMGEAVPHAFAPMIAGGAFRCPSGLAVYLGSKVEETPGAAWIQPQPCIEDPEKACFDYDPDNLYWKSTLKAVRERVHIGKGKFLTGFPTLFEGLDALATMRGTEKLLLDLIDRPNWVHYALRRITDVYFHYYDMLYDLIRDEIGGSHFWIYAPGRTTVLQCDFSSMISPQMFGEFMVPVLKEMSERISYCIYHWDGPGALPHHDHLLSIPSIQVLQWTPGTDTGVEPVFHKRWWPMYHKTIEAGKAVMLVAYGRQYEQLRKMKREFREKFKRFLWWIWEVESVEQGQKILDCVTD